jgi:hypothetical protein
MATKATIAGTKIHATARKALFVNRDVNRSTIPPYTAIVAAVCPEG